MQTTYEKTEWLDHIVDLETGDIIQEGTRFTASRANNAEEGIDNAHEMIDVLKSDNQKLRVQIEMIGRVPVNNGTFYDTLDGQNPKQLTRLIASAVSQISLAVGATVVTLDSAPFAVGEYVTIYDDAQSETVKISAVNASTITVTAFTKAFKKGAFVRRTSAIFDSADNEIKFGNWGTYSVAVSEVV